MFLPCRRQRSRSCPDAAPFHSSAAANTVKVVKNRYGGGRQPWTAACRRKKREISGFKAALADKPRSGKPSVIKPEEKARITALACSDAPEGFARWTLRLLADKAVEMGYIESISHMEVSRILKKTLSSRTNKSNGASEKSPASI